MNGHTDASIDQALRELAYDDARAVAPVELEAAVLRAWDQQPARQVTERPVFRGRRIAGWTLVPVAAAGALAVALLLHAPATAPDRRLRVAGDADPIDVPRVPVVIPEPPETYSLALPAAARPVVANAQPQPIETGYVIVPDPFTDPTELHLLRVRMSRGALAMLGMPTVAPDAEGLVDVDMLVGNDGVAQAIQRATFVSDTTDRGADR